MVFPGVASPAWSHASTVQTLGQACAEMNNWSADRLPDTLDMARILDRVPQLLAVAQTKLATDKNLLSRFILRRQINCAVELYPKAIALAAHANTMLAACQLGLGSLVIELVKAGQSPHQCDAHGSTTVHLAVRANAVALVAFLLEQKCEVNAIDGSGYTPLRWAIDLQQPAVTRLLLRAGAPPEQKVPTDVTRHIKLDHVVNGAGQTGKQLRFVYALLVEGVVHDAKLDRAALLQAWSCPHESEAQDCAFAEVFKVRDLRPLIWERLRLEDQLALRVSCKRYCILWYNEVMVPTSNRAVGWV